MITIDKISKKYGSQKVLDQVQLELRAGQSVALIGPNGSGKTTLIKTILSLVRPDAGTINVQGENVAGSGAYRNAIGYMPQMSRFPENMSVGQLFALMKKLRPEVPEDHFDLELYRTYEIGAMKNKKLSALSGGMKQKVSAALAFLFRPDILILDEPTAGLDPISNERLKQKIQDVLQEKKLVLITSHILSDLDEIVNQVAYLIEGRLMFFKSLDQLKQETSEMRLNKIIVALLQEMNDHVEDH